MKELVEAIARALVDYPDQVRVHAIEGERVTVIQLRVHPSDVGKMSATTGGWPSLSAPFWVRRA